MITIVSYKVRRNKFKNNRFIKSKAGILVIVLGVLVLISLIMLFPHLIRDTYSVTVTNKRIVNHNNTDMFYIYTLTEDGEIRVFENTDNFIEMKYDSDDIYWAIAINKKYEITAYGINAPLFSDYQNIVKVKGIQ